MATDKEMFHVRSIQTLVFTPEGRVGCFLDANNSLTTLPTFFLGHRERGEKRNAGSCFFVLNNDQNDYEREVAYFFALHDKNVAFKALEEEWLVPNDFIPMDVGNLYPHLASVQIGEMANLKTPSYIRIKHELYEFQENVLNDCETRYVVLPENETFNNLQYFETFELEELKNDDRDRNLPYLVSNQLRWFLSSDEYSNALEFANQLKTNYQITHGGSKQSGGGRLLS